MPVRCQSTTPEQVISLRSGTTARVRCEHCMNRRDYPGDSFPGPLSSAFLAACGEENQPRPAPIARRPSGDSMVPGALIKICTPEDEGCFPTYTIMCPTRWRGDPAQKSQLSPEEQAWCEQHVPNDRSAAEKTGNWP